MRAVVGSQQLPSMNGTAQPVPISVMVHAMAYTTNSDDAAFYMGLITDVCRLLTIYTRFDREQIWKSNSLRDESDFPVCFSFFVLVSLITCVLFFAIKICSILFNVWMHTRYGTSLVFYSLFCKTMKLRVIRTVYVSTLFAFFSLSLNSPFTRVSKCSLMITMTIYFV